jgi:hypothetical protein
MNNKNRVLIVDLIDPSGTRYLDVALVGNYMWSRDKKEYKIFRVVDYEMIPIDISEVTDVKELQDLVNKAMAD